MPPRSAAPPPLPLLVRQLHIYVSAFVAPSLLFFAASGAVQTFRLPDKPAAPLVVQKLARLHKDAVFAPKPVRKPPGAGAAVRGPRPEPAKPALKPAVEALKWFFAAASVGMVFSTLFGLWMGLKWSRRKALVLILTAAGAAIPLLLVAAAA